MSLPCSFPAAIRNFLAPKNKTGKSEPICLSALISFNFRSCPRCVAIKLQGGKGPRPAGTYACRSAAR
jgi:hypothetical protein